MFINDMDNLKIVRNENGEKMVYIGYDNGDNVFINPRSELFSNGEEYSKENLDELEYILAMQSANAIFNEFEYLDEII